MSNSTLAIVEVDETTTLERERLKKKALSIINLAVRDCVVPYILDIEDPTFCWERLKNLYATNNNARRMLLRRKLTNLKMEEGTMMSTFLQSVQDLVNQLAGIGEKIPDDEIAEHMLTALPELYEPLVSSVAYRTEMPTLSELTSLLLNEEIRREVRTSKREGEVLLVQSKNKGYQPRKYSGRNHQYPCKLSIVPKEMGACHFCGGKDHFMRNCEELAGEIQRRGANRRGGHSRDSANLVDNFTNNGEVSLMPGRFWRHKLLAWILVKGSGI